MAQKGQILYFLKAALLWFVLKLSIEIIETVALNFSPWVNYMDTGLGGVQREQTIA